MAVLSTSDWGNPPSVGNFYEFPVMPVTFSVGDRVQLRNGAATTVKKRLPGNWYVLEGYEGVFPDSVLRYARR